VSDLVLAAVTRHDIASYVSTLLLIYTILVFIRVLMSWFTRIPYNRVLMAVLDFVRETTDPYLNLFRRFVPMVKVGPGALDLSPIVAIIVLQVVGGIVVRLIAG
jgi:YggT family protein